jgi:hypothetical protein
MTVGLSYRVGKFSFGIAASRFLLPLDPGRINRRRDPLHPCIPVYGRAFAILTAIGGGLSVGVTTVERVVHGDGAETFAV